MTNREQNYYWMLIAYLFICGFSGCKSLNITLGASHGIDDIDLRNCYLRTDPTLTGVVQSASVSVSVVELDQISESTMDFRLHGYVCATWTNPRLNITVYNQSFPIVLPPKLAECMWKPDIFFPNSNEVKIFTDPVPNSGMKYRQNGEIYWFQRLIFRVSCSMHFALYPFDTQHCNFLIALVANSDDKAILHWDKDPQSGGFYYYYDMHTLQFRISRPSIDSFSEKWGNDTFTTLRANVTFYRLLTGSFLNYYMPSSLVVILSWISFYLDVEAVPARVTLGVTALLTISTQMIQARNALPPVQYVTSMDIWLFFCLLLVFSSFIEYSIAYSYRNKSKRVVKEKEKIVKDRRIKKTPAWVSINQPENNLNTVPSSEKFDRISRWFFPLVMLIFAISYFSFLFIKTEIKL